MNTMWILAEAGGDGGETETIVMESDSATAEQTTTTAQDGGNGVPDEAPKETPNMSPIMMIMIPLLLVYMFFMFRGPKKKQQEHNKMVSSLAKNDRVRTIGGIFGTVLDVRDDEIVLKIDESTNTKIKVSPQAIATVLND